MLLIAVFDLCGILGFVSFGERGWKHSKRVYGFFAIGGLFSERALTSHSNPSISSTWIHKQHKSSVFRSEWRFKQKK